MSVLRANVAGNRVAPSDLSAILVAAAALAPNQPVTIMVHGYRYDPKRPLADPQRDLYAPRQSSGPALSWPRHLGYREDTAPGLAIGLAWPACGSIVAAHLRAERAGVAMAHLVTAIRQVAPTCPINTIGHSLGARVILLAIAALPPAHLSRAVLLSAAAFRADANAALAGPSGQTTEIINITTRENDVFDFLMEFALTAGFERSLGQGLPNRPTNWLDLQIDNPRVLARLETLGFPVASARRRICHWSAYSRPGVFALYRALLTDPAPLPLAVLARAAALPQDPRWTRLLSAPRAALPLPFRLGAPS